MIPGDPLDSRLDSATSELRSQLGDAPIPEFEPRPRTGGPVAAIVVALLLVGAIGFTQLRTSTSELDVVNDPDQTESIEPDENTAPVIDEEPAPDTPDADGAPVPSGRNSDALTTQPADVAITLGEDDTAPAIDLARPAIGASYNDPAYNSVVTRVTDAGGRFNRIDNNRRQIVNADNTLLLTHIDDGSREVMAVTSLSTLELVTELPVRDDAEAMWHPTNPDVVRHLRGGNASNGSLQLFETNVVTNTTVTIADLTERIVAVAPNATHMITGYGKPSADGNVWTWIARDDTESPIIAVTYDLPSDTILASTTDLDITDDGNTYDLVTNETIAAGPTDLYSVSTSPSGSHAVFEFRGITVVYDIAFKDYRPIPNTGDSSDVVTQASGRDSYVYIDFNSLSTDVGFLVAVDLDTFERTRLFEVFGGANTSVEVSGAAVDAPGWAVVSTYDCKDAGAWTCDKVLAVELAGEGRIVSLAHTYSCADSFLTVPTATPTRDLSHIYFNSDAGSCTEAAEMYEILTPDPLQQIVAPK